MLWSLRNCQTKIWKTGVQCEKGHTMWKMAYNVPARALIWAIKTCFKPLVILNTFFQIEWIKVLNEYFGFNFELNIELNHL